MRSSTCSTAAMRCGTPLIQGRSDKRNDAPAARCRLAIEQIEVVHHLLDELRRLVFVEMEDLQVADLVGMRHGMDRPGFGLRADRAYRR